MPFTQISEKHTFHSQSPSTVLLKRLPIYDHHMNVYAYELMPYTKKNECIDDDVKSADVMINALMSFDFVQLVGNAKVVLPITETLIKDVADLPFDKRQVMYGLPNYYDFNDTNKKMISHFMQQGHQFAINVNRSIGEVIKDLPKVSLIKLNAAQFNAKNLNAVTIAGKHNIVISNIKTLEEYQYYCKIGFKYCQGYFLGQSVIYKSKQISADLHNILDLLGALNNQESSVEQLEYTLNKDVALTYKIMRFINSPYFGLRVSVDSVKQALVLIGQKELRIWATMLLLSGRDDTPCSMSELVLVRAKFCELLSDEAGLANKDVFFSAGLFSGLNMLLCASLESIVEKLPLSDEMKRALLRGEGELGEALHCAQCYESGALEELSFQQLTQHQMGEAFESAVAWVYDIMATIQT